jgi:predicted 2-oxoglutarate/Fe(II)-dependent dioxygenase YbiX
MQYGSHVDDALMQGMRTDVSFTLFLSDPESYDGGELVIESASGEDAVRGLADRHVQRHLAEERHAEPLGLVARAAMAEDVGALAAMRADRSSSCSRRCRAPAR